MKLSEIDPHDLKAEIRKRFTSLAAFERTFDLPRKSVTDFCRRRPSSRVEKAILSVIRRPVSEFSQSEYSDSSAPIKRAHRLNAEGR